MHCVGVSLLLVDSKRLFSVFFQGDQRPAKTATTYCSFGIFDLYPALRSRFILFDCVFGDVSDWSSSRARRNEYTYINE